MQRIVLITYMFCFFIAQGFADEAVKKVSKSSVKIAGIGTFDNEENAKFTNDFKRMESINKFKGKGIAGKLAGKFFAKSGDNEEIINLPEMNVYELNLKKKKCTVRPIINIMDSLDAKKDLKSITESIKSEREKDATESKNNDEIEIIISEFKVHNLGEKEVFNNFSCNKFWINAYAKWRNKSSGQTGTDSLSIYSWMTPETDALQKAQSIEMNFSKAYLEKLGMNVDQMQQDVLGSKWLEKLQQIKGQDVGTNSMFANMAEEMTKLKGFYAVTTDGKYYAVRPDFKKPNEEQDDSEESTDITDVKKNIGGFAKGLFGKKKPEGPKPLEPMLEFYSELKQFDLISFEPGDFQSPYKCEEK